MMLLASLCIILVPLGWTTYSSSLDDYWKLFKARHGKIYKNSEEETYRRFVFEGHVRRIVAHNLAADLGNHSFTLGLNGYSDLTGPEFRKRMNGYRGGQSLLPEWIDHLVKEDSTKPAPSSVDWRKKGAVTPVKNQEMCGSCWAFSATGALEGQHFLKTGNLTSLSEQNLVDCSQEEGNMGCEGGLMTYAFKYVKRNHGLDTEKCYPYKGIDEDCHFKRRCVGTKCLNYTALPSGNERKLQLAVAYFGPISVAIDASLDTFMDYRGGVYDDPECSNSIDDLDHGVLVVGYDTTPSGQAYWIVKNSWGNDWGEEGYIRMARNKKNLCGIATEASFPNV